LREIPTDSKANKELSREPTSSSAGMQFTGSIGCREFNIFKAKAIDYMNSFPGSDNNSPNRYHRQLKPFIAGQMMLDEESRQLLSDVIDYRQGVMQIATDYISLLGIDFPISSAFDTDAWVKAAAAEQGKLERVDPFTSVTRFQQYNLIRSYIWDKKLFDSALRFQGDTYIKPRDYVAIALYESGCSYEEACAQVDKLLKCKSSFLCTAYCC
jgi:hypothetical protein